MQSVAPPPEADRIDIEPAELQTARLAWLSESIRLGTYRIDADRVAASIIDHLAA